MPRLQNLRRIKDTATGKYLFAVGENKRSWRRDYGGEGRNNSWNDAGTYYRVADVSRALDDAAHSLACFEYRKENTIPPGVDWNKWDDYTPEERARLSNERSDAQNKMHAWATEHAEIPETWIVEDIFGNSVSAKEWD